MVLKLTRILLLEQIRNKIAVESQQNIAVKSFPGRIAAKAHQILLSKSSREIATKSQQNIAAKTAQRKNMGRFPAKPKQPRQQMEPTPSPSQLLSSELFIFDKSRHQKDLLIFEYTIIIVTPTKLLSHQILLPQMPRENLC